MSKKPKKIREDDNLDGVRAALEHFDVDASVGRGGLDRQIGKLIAARPSATHREIRHAIRKAARSALGQKFYKSVGYPRDATATQKFFSDLQAAADLHRRISAFDGWQAFDVVDRERRDGSMGPLPSGDEANLEAEIDAIKQSLAQAAALIENFVETTRLPGKRKTGGRTILFTYHFIEFFVVEWRVIFGASPSKEDLADVSAVLEAALVELKYPLLKSHRLSPGWLSERIRKQIFRN